MAISKDFIVKNGIRVDSTSNVNGSATFANSVIVTGNVTFSNSVVVTGNVTFANSVAINGLVNITGNINTSGQTNTTTMYITTSANVGTAFTANSTLVNAIALNVVGRTNTATLYVTTSANVGTAFTTNSTLTNTVALNVVNQTNTATFYATTSANVGTAFTANSTLVNAIALNVVNQTNTATFYATTSANVGTAFTANSTLVNAIALNVVNQTNTGTLFATTSANVGANVQANTTAIKVGNSTVYSQINTTHIFAYNAVYASNAAIVTANGSTGGHTLIFDSGTDGSLYLGHNYIAIAPVGYSGANGQWSSYIDPVNGFYHFNPVNGVERFVGGIDGIRYNSTGGVSYFEANVDYTYSVNTVLVNKTIVDSGATAGVELRSTGTAYFTRSAATPLILNRLVDDGTIVSFQQAGTAEGSISIAGTVTSYNAFCGSHWSQLSDNSKPNILRGTVVETIDEMCEWVNESNDQLAKFKISDTVASKSVYGVFLSWDNDDEESNDAYIASLGAFAVRIAAGVVVSKGDLLESAGNGCARVQSDDIIRSSTIGKVTNGTHIIETYSDGSYLVPAVLYCG